MCGTSFVVGAHYQTGLLLTIQEIWNASLHLHGRIFFFSEAAARQQMSCGANVNDFMNYYSQFCNTISKDICFCENIAYYYCNKRNLEAGEKEKKKSTQQYWDGTSEHETPLRWQQNIFSRVSPIIQSISETVENFNIFFFTLSFILTKFCRLFSACVAKTKWCRVEAWDGLKV